VRVERKLAGVLKIPVIDDVDADLPHSPGHAIGDCVLVEVARRIVSNVRARVSLFPKTA